MSIKRFLSRAYMKVKHEALRIKVKNEKWHEGVTQQKRNQEIMISLTSYPKRFPEIELCIKSLVNQSMKADRIVLWLGNDTSIEEMERLKDKYASYGLEVYRDADNNFYSHKKYYYAMRDYPDDIIVTADDDMIYPPDWLSSLYRSYVKHPDCISARRVGRITWDAQGQPLPYIQWPGDVKAKAPSHSLYATTGAGALFPPRCLGKEALNHAVSIKKARTSDDLWVKTMAVLSGVKVVWAENTMIMPTTINLHQDQALSNMNVENGQNDIIFRDLCAYYQLGENDFS